MNKTNTLQYFVALIMFMYVAFFDKELKFENQVKILLFLSLVMIEIRIKSIKND